MAKHNLRLHLGKETVEQPVNSVSGRLESTVYSSPSALNISPIRSSEVVPMASVSQVSFGSQNVVANGPQSPGPVPFVRKFLRCPVHVEEPLQFFCLTCECECICAECALHGGHRSHDVLNLRDAAKQLPERAADLMSAARLRAAELTGVVDGVSKEARNVAGIVGNRRRELSNQFEQVRSGLAAEEKALMSEVQRCSREVAEILHLGDFSQESIVRESHSELQRHHGLGDAISALNALVKLNRTLAVAPPPRSDGIVVHELKATAKGL